MTEEIDLATYFEEVVKKSNNPKSSANWIMTEVLRILKKKIFHRNFSIRSENLAKIIVLIDSGTISSKIAKEVFELSLNDDRIQK